GVHTQEGGGRRPALVTFLPALRFLHFSLSGSYLYSIFIPALNFYIFYLIRAERSDKGRSKSGIGEQGNIKIDGTSPDDIIVFQLPFRGVFRDVDNQIKFLARKHVFHIQFSGFIGPVYRGTLDAVVAQETERAPGGKQFETFLR